MSFSLLHLVAIVLLMYGGALALAAEEKLNSAKSPSPLVANQVASKPVNKATAPVKRRPRAVQEFLSPTYYAQSCPNAEQIIHDRVQYWVQQDFTLAASLIRLHFHDCVVRGCDASILLNYGGSERDSTVSRTLRGFNVVDDIKQQLENACPRTVSCADILTTIARDASLLLGGPFWSVPFGRKDGRISLARETYIVPQGHENLTALIELFQSRGLSILDLVILSGAHTIGRSVCSVIQDRLYNFNGTRKPDPTIDPTYVTYLQKKCTYGWNWGSNLVHLDPTTPNVLDAVYYQNLQNKKGLFVTDQLLYSDARTQFLIDTLASNPYLFYQQFSVSMVNLGNVQVLTGDEGEVRTNCNWNN